tara:strand:- start:549 stop:1613 length:1065 start_codon:yes stop_codon:yes gene_type:complete
MNNYLKFFKKRKFLQVDEFMQAVLYDKKFGYYNSKYPFGKKGDYVTAPKISNLFSEIIAIWMISTWEFFGKPKVFNIVEMGPGDGSLAKILLRVFKKFPEFNKAKKISLYEISNFLKKEQKKNLKNENVKWIDNLSNLKEGPIIFFGNEYFDAIPIKQFKNKKDGLFEKYYEITKNKKIKEVFKKASSHDLFLIKSFKTLKNLKLIEFPKLGFIELKKMIKKILRLRGCILIIDYGYIKSKNQYTLQSVMNHKKNKVTDNLGKADITSQVNFALLTEFFKKNKLEVKDPVSQQFFLKKMGIIERAEIISKKMKFNDQTSLYLSLKRLLSPNSMGNLFKVIMAYNFKKKNFYGFK